jgi:hypothetical protein
MIEADHTVSQAPRSRYARVRTPRRQGQGAHPDTQDQYKDAVRKTGMERESRQSDCGVRPARIGRITRRVSDHIRGEKRAVQPSEYSSL